ncbi:MAG: RnfABCDGE type electron transport complex subunit D [Oscillospiraceae bacterium]
MSSAAVRPPVHEGYETGRDAICMILPLLAMACYLYGPRPAAICAVAIATAIICDRIVAILRHIKYDKTENSSVAFSLVLVMMLPASVNYYVVIASVAIAVFIGKAAFGGYGAYPFSPAALGYAVAAVSWPKEVFFFPEPFSMGWEHALSTEGLALIESSAHTLKTGGLPNISTFNLILGNYAGPMGATAVLVILACAAYLWARRRITLTAPVSFLAVCMLIAFLFPRLGDISLSWPWINVAARAEMLKYELLSGAMLFAAVFLINDPVTLPKNEISRLVYGIILGIATMMFRYFGTYETGVCFALLAVNSLSGYIDRVVMRLTAHKKGVLRREQ